MAVLVAPWTLKHRAVKPWKTAALQRVLRDQDTHSEKRFTLQTVYMYTALQRYRLQTRCLERFYY
jgi:hypothetical protein